MSVRSVFVRWSCVGLVLGLVTIGLWYTTRSPNVALVASGTSGDSLGLNLVTELLLVIPVLFALGYGLTAVLSARKPELGRLIHWLLPVVLVIPVVGCLLALPQHYELVPSGGAGHYPQVSAAALAIGIAISALAVSVVWGLRDRSKSSTRAYRRE
jgi:hypothetical protein